jgi:hypothetical protein
MNFNHTVIAVGDNIYQKLHDRFDKGERNVHSGKLDGKDRSLYRNANYYIKDRNTDNLILPKSVLQLLPNVVVKTRTGQKGIDVGSEWHFSSFTYDNYGNPKYIKYININNGNIKSVTINRREAARCAKCDFAGISISKCAKCKKVYYCSFVCQKAHWKLHKKTCIEKRKKRKSTKNINIAK